MAEIYILTAGEYSDYRIIGATTDKEEALKIQKEFNWNRSELSCEYVEIETYNDFKDGRVLETIQANNEYWFLIDAYKNTIIKERCQIYEKEDSKKLSLSTYEMLEDAINDVGSTLHHIKDKNQVTIMVYAKTKEQARKIAMDRYYQWKYEEMGF